MSRTLQPNDTIRDWTIERRLGGGGQAVTWLARDQTGQRVALKQLVLKRAETWKEIELFQREAAVLASLDHPAIPRFLAAFEETAADGSVDFFLVQAFVDAPSIAALMASGRTFDTAAFVAIARAALDVLGWLHRRQPPVIHRDIKPSNLLFDARQSLHLIDFGAVIAHIPNTDDNHSTIVGTHGYMPPEQLMGRASPASDLYGLGATLIHVASGHHPGRLPLDGLRPRFRDVVTLPSPLVAWLDTLIAPDPGARPASAEAALAALEAALLPPQPSPPPVATKSPAPSAARRKSRWVPAGILMGMMGLASIGMLNTRSSNDLQPPSATTAVAGTLVAERPPVFVAIPVVVDSHSDVRVTARRAMLRRAEVGFPMSSLDLAFEITSTANMPIDRVETILVLKRFRQESRLILSAISELDTPLEPGETRVMTAQFTDVTNTIDGIEVRFRKVSHATDNIPARNPRRFVPAGLEPAAMKELLRVFDFEEQRVFESANGQATKDRVVADIRVRVLEMSDIKFFELQPRCHPVDGPPKRHMIADQGLQLSPDRLFPGESPWLKVGDTFTYRAICPAATASVSWEVTALKSE